VLTVTEALAEIKTIEARIAKKEELIRANLVRDERFRDPLAPLGQFEAVRRELQARDDLEERRVQLRRAIQRVNESTDVTVGGQTRTIADWLVWRREVAPKRQAFLSILWGTIQQAREKATKAGGQLVSGEKESTPSAGNLVVNVDEQKLAAEREELETILGQLDGLLSLKNATVGVEL